MPVSVERVVELSSERSQLWCAIGDTERMNRAVGLGPLEVSPHADSSAARYLVKTVSSGFALEYEERPFEWRENEHFRIHRLMRRGVVRSMTNEFWLTPLPGGGTSVRFRLQVEPRWVLFAPIAKLELLRFASRIIRELRQVEQDVKNGLTACFRTSRSEVDEVSLARTARVLDDALPAERRDLGKKLVDHVRLAPDADVVRRGNVYARCRMIVLYDVSAETGGLVLGTSNKTELLLGYGTLHGDLASAVNPLGDLYKAQVWSLSREVGVPEAIVDKPPSADLRPGQTDEADLGFSYRDVDRLLYAMIDLRYRREELIAAGFAAEFVDRVAARVRGTQFKRRLPVIAKVSSRTTDCCSRSSH